MTPSFCITKKCQQDLLHNIVLIDEVDKCHARAQASCMTRKGDWKHAQSIGQTPKPSPDGPWRVAPVSEYSTRDTGQLVLMRPSRPFCRCFTIVDKLLSRMR